MQRFRTGDGAEVRFVDRGSGGLPLVFVHGWQADHTVWNDVIAALAPGMRTIAVDLRGSGESGDAPGPYNLDRYAADVRELLDGLAVRPAVVVGHSMGAKVALRLALDAPEAVAAVILIAPVATGAAGFTQKGVDFLRATAGDPVATRKWLSRAFAGEPPPGLLDRVCAIAAKTSRQAALESFESWSGVDLADASRTIAVPAIVMAPQHDDPEMQHSKVATLLRNARYVVLPDCGHYAILERPDAIAKLILNRTSNELAARTCVPCRGGVPPLDAEQIAPLLAQLDAQWKIVERAGPRRETAKILTRAYSFKNFAQAMSAAARIGEMAEEQQHHPDLQVSWGRLGVEIWTHKIGGLTESDFIFAAKCDALVRSA
jgi:4a-hydroxytetrahydrobiopterin dehydratase